MTTEPIRNKKDIEDIKQLLLSRNKIRDYALFVAGINTALRISDLLEIKWGDIYTENKTILKRHLVVIEQKTGKKNIVALNENTKQAFLLLSRNKNFQMEEFIFKSAKNVNRPITRIRAYQIIKKISKELELDENISCHSLRKTFGYHAWKKGTPPALIMNIYNHSNIEITKRYLCINQDDRDELFNEMNL